MKDFVHVDRNCEKLSEILLFRQMTDPPDAAGREGTGIDPGRGSRADPTPKSSVRDPRTQERDFERGKSGELRRVVTKVRKPKKRNMGFSSIPSQGGSPKNSSNRT